MKIPKSSPATPTLPIPHVGPSVWPGHGAHAVSFWLLSLSCSGGERGLDRDPGARFPGVTCQVSEVHRPLKSFAVVSGTGEITTPRRRHAVETGGSRLASPAHPVLVSNLGG